VRKVRSEKNQVARSIIGGVVSYQALAGTLEDQRQFVLRVVVPAETKLVLASLISVELVRTGGDFLEVGFDKHLCTMLCEF
jgi:hypothetical protein